jgi:hypothetical protein
MKEKIRVAFQGEKGAYSHLASLEVFPNANMLLFLLEKLLLFFLSC